MSGRKITALLSFHIPSKFADELKDVNLLDVAERITNRTDLWKLVKLPRIGYETIQRIQGETETVPEAAYEVLTLWHETVVSDQAYVELKSVLVEAGLKTVAAELQQCVEESPSDSHPSDHESALSERK